MWVHILIPDSDFQVQCSDSVVGAVRSPVVMSCEVLHCICGGGGLLPAGGQGSLPAEGTLEGCGWVVGSVSMPKGPVAGVVFLVLCPTALDAGW